MNKNDIEELGPSTTRRRFLRASIIGGAAGVVTSLPFATDAALAAQAWDNEVDVVVVGSGVSGLVAAVTAAAAGASVVIIEKAPVVGGTTAKSDGGYWIPNNRFMREKGIVDNRADAVAFMARCARPQLYKPGATTMGLPEREFRLLEAYYDNGSKAVEFLDQIGALKSNMFVPWPDYAELVQENKAPRGRALCSMQADGTYGRGRELVRQLKAWVDGKKIPVLLRNRATGLVRNDNGEVVGLQVRDKEGHLSAIRARKGVIFGSGGFGQNPELLLNYQPAPIFGACAVPGAEGDFVKIGQKVGAKLGNMAGSWHVEVLLEQAIEVRSMPRVIVQPPGDSMILVNKHGKRVVGEKRNYHDRTQSHFVWDPQECDYPNKLLFMVYDSRTAELFAGNYPLPPPGAAESYVISAPSLEELGSAIQSRLNQLSGKIGEIHLTDSFAQALQMTIGDFNRYAKAGVDEQFGRGSQPYDRDWDAIYSSVPRTDTSWKAGGYPNPTLHPIQAKGPYFAIIVAASTLDTNGGPVINPFGQVLDAEDQPIPGLYGAGNCIASPAAQAYWGGGTTVGSGLVFGYLAGNHAASASVKQAETPTSAVAKT